MERQPELEQVQRLTGKPLDQTFVARAVEGLRYRAEITGCRNGDAK